MIRITNLTDLKKENTHFDEIWVIMRYVRNLGPDMKQVAWLAPSQELFTKYRQLVNENAWDRAAWETIYVPQFLYELKTNGKAYVWDALNYLWKADREGKSIAVCCSCTDESMCHRSVVGGLLQAVGCNVIMDTKTDYSVYKKMLDEIDRPVLADRPTKCTGAFQGESYFLSNMYPAPVTIPFFGQDITFTCSEAAYQASKCPERVNDFIGLNGYQAKALGKKVKMDPGFDYGKVEIMRKIVTAKFEQNPDLISKLLKTQGPLVEENSWGDTFWGCVDGKGQNHLGLILMGIRKNAGGV